MSIVVGLLALVGFTLGVTHASISRWVDSRSEINKAKAEVIRRRSE